MKPFAILLLLGALLLAFGSLSARWISTSEARDGEYASHFGLLHSEHCAHGDCVTEINLKEASRVHGLREVVLVGSVTLAGLAGLAAAILAVVGALGRKRGPAVAIVIACSIGFACVLAFMLAGELRPSSLDIAAYAYVGGAILALVGAILAIKASPLAIRPVMMYPGMMPPMGMQPGFMAPPAHMVPQTPPCNQCGGQTQFVQQYGRLFCGRCNRYIV